MPDWVSPTFGGLLAVALAVAAIAKLVSPADTLASVRSLGVPLSLASGVRWVLPVAELGVAALLVVPASRGVGAVAAIALCSAFTVVIGVNLARGRRPPCACFGSRSAEPISGRTLVRNAVLVAAAVLALP